MIVVIMLDHYMIITNFDNSDRNGDDDDEDFNDLIMLRTITPIAITIMTNIIKHHYFYHYHCYRNFCYCYSSSTNNDNLFKLEKTE